LLCRPLLTAEGDPAYEQEVFLATRRGRRMLDLSRFHDRDCAQCRDWCFATFVHAYATYLDDRLKHRMQARGAGGASLGKWHVDGDPDGMACEVAEAWEPMPRGRSASATETTAAEDVIGKAQQLKHLLGRFIQCRPTGKARTNPVVTVALYRLVKESATMYCELMEVMVVLLDRFADLGTPACMRVHSIFTSLAKLVDELDDFYLWCKATDVCHPSDIPEIQRVKQMNLDLMDEFIHDRQASAPPCALVARCSCRPIPRNPPSTPRHHRPLYRPMPLTSRGFLRLRPASVTPAPCPERKKRSGDGRRGRRHPTRPVDPHQYCLRDRLAHLSASSLTTTTVVYSKRSWRRPRSHHSRG
jgi:hypothetical protein